MSSVGVTPLDGLSRRVSPRPGSRSRSGRSSARFVRPAGRCSSAILLTIGLPVLFAAVDLVALGHMTPGTSAPTAIRSTSRSRGQRLAARDRRPGVLVITGEYSTGMIRATIRRRAQAAARALGQGRRLRRGHVRR